MAIYEVLYLFQNGASGRECLLGEKTDMTHVLRVGECWIRFLKTNVAHSPRV